MSLRLPPKSRRQNRLQHPLQLLYPLEVPQAARSTSQEVTVTEEDDIQAPTRPQRESASKARHRVKEWTQKILRDPNYDSS